MPTVAPDPRPLTLNSPAAGQPAAPVDRKKQPAQAVAALTAALSGIPVPGISQAQAQPTDGQDAPACATSSGRAETMARPDTHDQRQAVAAELAFRLTLTGEGPTKPVEPLTPERAIEGSATLARDANPLQPSAVPTPPIQADVAPPKPGETTDATKTSQPDAEPVKTPAAGANTTGRDDSQRDHRSPRQPAVEFSRDAVVRTPTPHDATLENRFSAAGFSTERPANVGTEPKAANPVRETGASVLHETKTPSVPAPVRQVLLRLGEPSKPIDLRVWERGGTVQVSVRSSDSSMTVPLRTELPALMSNLERAGYRGEAHVAEGTVRADTEPTVQATAQSEYGWTQDQSNPNRRQPDETAKPGKPKDGEAGNFTLDLAGEAYDD